MTDKTFLCVKPYLHIAEGSAVMEEGWIDYPHINIFKNSKSIDLRRSRRQKPFPICVHEGYSHFQREIRLKSCTNTKFRLMKTLQMNEKKREDEKSIISWENPLHKCSKPKIFFFKSQILPKISFQQSSHRHCNNVTTQK